MHGKHSLDCLNLTRMKLESGLEITMCAFFAGTEKDIENRQKREKGKYRFSFGLLSNKDRRIFISVKVEIRYLIFLVCETNF